MIIRFQWLFVLALLVGLTACPTDPPPQPTNRAPTAAFTTLETVQAGTPLAFDASPSSDPDKDALAFSWDFGDGQNGGVAKIAHVFAAAGSFKVKLTVSDGKGGLNSLEKTVTVSAAPPPSKTVLVQGLVKGIDDKALAGVNVAVVGNSVSSTTGADGKVSLNLGVGVNVTLKLSKDGFTDQFKVINLPNNVGTDGYFEASLMPREAAQNLEAGSGGNLTGKDGAQISLEAGSLVDSSGKPVSGGVQVSMTPVDVTGAALSAFPGKFEGINPDGARGSIVSYGTVEFMLSQGGQKVQVAPGKKATVELPIYANTNLDSSSLKAGDTIPLWSLDENTGVWINEGEGTVVASASSPTGFALQAQVAHFSWWNTDRFDDPWGPKPKCVNDVPGQYDNIFAQAQICNMIADIDRGLSGSSVRANPPRLPSTQASASIPMGGGQSFPIPAGVNVILRGSILNGTWQGKVTVNEAKGTSKEVLIPLRPVTIGGNDETISLPFSGTRVAQTGATNRYSFSTPTSQWLRVSVTQASSSLQGTVRLLNGATEVYSANFPSANATFKLLLPSAGTYTIEVKGTANTPGGYQLEAAFLSLNQKTIALPFDGTQTLQNTGIDRYQFSGEVGKYLKLSAVRTGANLSASLKLFSPSGTLLGSSVFSDQLGALFIKLEEAGNYSLEVISTFDTSGAYRLQVGLTDAGNVNQVQTVSLADGQSLSYAFPASAGMVIHFYSKQTDSPGYFGRFSLTDPDGIKLVNGTDSVLIGLTRLLSKDGVYTVELRSVGLAGKYLLTSSLVENPTALPLNTRVDINDTLGRLGVAKYFSLELNKGDLIKLVLSVPASLQNSLAVAYKVGAWSTSQGIASFEGGGGDLLNDVTNRFRLSDIAYSPATTTGRYLLKFESRCLKDCAGYNTSSFPYSFTVLRPNPIPLSLDTPITSAFTEPYGLEVYSLNITDPGYYGLFFNPTAAKPALESYDSFVLEAFDPNMTQIQGLAYRDFKLFPTKLSAGNHTLRVNKRYADAAPYTLSAIKQGPPVPISVPSGLVNASIDIPAQSRFYSLARTANQSLKVSLSTQGSWSACLSMYKILPNGDYTSFGEAPVNQCFGTLNGNGQSTNFSYIPPSDGTYIIQIKGMDPSGNLNQTGSYTLSLSTP